jgi:hypothetical protein
MGLEVPGKILEKGGGMHGSCVPFQGQGELLPWLGWGRMEEFTFPQEKSVHPLITLTSSLSITLSGGEGIKENDGG